LFCTLQLITYDH